ncbi:hypothetical protein LX16_3857 [Stackebrandtia albiflava]|uniref:Uncharacterized protein n=1 Tax=Stackebrandtia albiflava TaxID=406432 RepID=A0A562UXQ8_9ACTN|nr:hypothetical protein [Stackebrandtia albiflava]TWJ10440.1 hypothetical protein LX16_3857 [Stackebrandtia albiflava]
MEQPSEESDDITEWPPRLQAVLDAYARLQADPVEWASYVAEGAEWERVAVADLCERLKDEPWPDS